MSRGGSHDVGQSFCSVIPKPRVLDIPGGLFTTPLPLTGAAWIGLLECLLFGGCTGTFKRIVGTRSDGRWLAQARRRQQRLIVPLDASELLFKCGNSCAQFGGGGRRCALVSRVHGGRRRNAREPANQHPKSAERAPIDRLHRFSFIRNVLELVPGGLSVDRRPRSSPGFRLCCSGLTSLHELCAHT
jgi:hypothetical protein